MKKYLKLSGVEDGKKKVVVFAKAFTSDEKLDAFVENYLGKNPAFTVCAVESRPEPWPSDDAVKVDAVKGEPQKLEKKQDKKTTAKKSEKKATAKRAAKVEAIPSGVDTWMIGQTMPVPTVAKGGSLRVYKKQPKKAALDDITAAKVEALKAAGVKDIKVADSWIWFDIPHNLTVAQKCNIKMMDGIMYSSKRGHHYINLNGQKSWASKQDFDTVLALHHAVRV